MLQEYVVSSGVTSSGVVLSYDSMYVLNGGTAEGTTVKQRSYLHISNGGVANNTTINSSGCVYLSAGGSAGNTTVNNCGTFQLADGSIAGRITVQAGGTVNAASATFSGNWADNGGAIYNSQGTLNVSGATFSSNSAGYYGGAINNYGTTTITDATFSGNSASYNGGAICNYGTVNVSGGSFSGNSASYNGGAICNYGTVNVSGGSFSGNSAGTGGAIYNDSYYFYAVNITGATFSGNSAGTGGAIYNKSGTMTLTDAAFLTATDTIYNTGTMTFSGTITLAANLYTESQIQAAGAVVNLDISNYTALPDLLISDISNIAGASWQLTVTSDQAFGTYYLAGGAEAFSATITVQNPAGKELGTISVGGSLNVGERVLQLDSTNDLLRLTVTEAPPKGVVALYSSSTLVRSAATMTGETLAAGGNDSMTVFSGGEAYTTTVSSGGAMSVSSGGVANDTVVNSTGRLYVSSGGVANGTIVNSGAATYDSLDGGAMTVFNGGVANHTTVQGGPAYRPAYIGQCYGNLYVSNGGVANDTQVNPYGCLYVSDGGVANDTTVNGYNAFMAISSGGVANDTTVSSGHLTISNGGVANETTVNNGGYLSVSSGGVANDTTINDNGHLGIASGGVANDTIMSGGYLYVSEGGVANDTTMSAGVLRIYSGGVANNVNAEARTSRIYVSRGGVLNGLTVQSNALLELQGNGFSDVRIASGGNVSLIGCEDKSEILSATVYDGGLLTVYFNTKYDSAPATVRQATVSAGGEVIIDEKCSATDTLLASGGSMTIRALATAEDTRIAGGTLYVLQGGSVTNTEISAKGKMLLSGKAYDTTVNGGGALFVGFGSVAEDVTVTGNGGVYVMGGGEIKGDVSISQTGGLYLYGGSIVNGEIHVKGLLYVDETMVNNGEITVELNASTPSQAMIENLDYLAYTTCFAVDTAAVGLGNYTLASGAANYDGTVSVTDDGAELCSLSVGESQTVDDTTYTLNKTADTLSLSIVTAVLPIAQSDVDGNGVSDVMFQYTGGDYQIGFWMNGTSEWQGTGASQPAEWDLLGNYDMDNNGKADQVMVGNVEVGGVKGAYVGFYKDGDTTANGWQNIGYLNNGEDITWDNAVGNLTGNAGANSIVWHAAELGAAGVWTDGTTDWVSLGSGFDANWELQGCGDFTGDGADEVLWKYSGTSTLYTTDINGNFATLGAASGLAVRAIGDFSGDGIDDLVLFSEENGVVLKYENGLAENWSQLGQLDVSDWFIVGAGDYNNDQQDDLLVRQYSTGMLGYYSAGDLTQWNELGRGVDMQWTVIA